ncbi:hypothetical protein PUN28_003367 [Cardiocondyla obscurior]|uniref:Uncharacterized protein n=1 Tax=Cardiocondyla obscurior TaxID=286306 RepID=A0AAW2GKQ9_9HYME
MSRRLRSFEKSPAKWHCLLFKTWTFVMPAQWPLDLPRALPRCGRIQPAKLFIILSILFIFTCAPVNSLPITEDACAPYLSRLDFRGSSFASDPRNFRFIAFYYIYERSNTWNISKNINFSRTQFKGSGFFFSPFTSYPLLFVFVPTVLVSNIREHIGFRVRRCRPIPVLYWM